MGVLSATAQPDGDPANARRGGPLDGVPAWARDRANRRLLDRALARTPDAAAAATARAVADGSGRRRPPGGQVQLHLLDLEAEQVVLVLGDLDTAEAVGLLVPGITTRRRTTWRRLPGDARDVAAAARGAGARGVDVATAVWLGYATPGNSWDDHSRAPAWQGGRALAAELAGLAAARTATGNPPPRTTVLAHSYGTVVVDEAADRRVDWRPTPSSCSGAPAWRRTRAASRRRRCTTPPRRRPDLRSGAGSAGRTCADSYGSTGLPVDRTWGTPTTTTGASPPWPRSARSSPGVREPA